MSSSDSGKVGVAGRTCILSGRKNVPSPDRIPVRAVNLDSPGVSLKKAAAYVVPSWKEAPDVAS